MPANGLAFSVMLFGAISDSASVAEPSAVAVMLTWSSGRHESKLAIATPKAASANGGASNFCTGTAARTRAALPIAASTVTLPRVTGPSESPPALVARMHSAVWAEVGVSEQECLCMKARWPKHERRGTSCSRCTTLLGSARIGPTSDRQAVSHRDKINSRSCVAHYVQRATRAAPS